jgi:8-amino-7-oxononanoate synthase
MTLPDFHGVHPNTESTPARQDQTAVRGALSIFEKCRNFFDPGSLYSQVKAADLYPYFRPIEVSEGTRAVMNGRELIMAGSNNYLGLTSDPRVQDAAIDAIRRYGSGCTGSRFLNGTLDLHLQLEEKLAAFMGKEACVLFSTGYMTNQGVLQSLAGKGDLIFSDKDNHACIVAGTVVSPAETIRFRHNDTRHLRLLLEKHSAEQPDAGKIIVTDGVFSMSGVLATCRSWSSWPRSLARPSCSTMPTPSGS